MSIKVLIVDDHAVVRQGLRLLLEAQPQIEVVGEAADGEMAVQLAQTLQPDVILMDLMMPGMSGIDALRQLQAKQVSSRVLVLTSSLDDSLVRQALQAGAHGYILKASRASEMLRSIEQVAQGMNVLDPAATQMMMQQVRGSDPLTALTGREREVFDWLARGLNYVEIAEKLGVSEATVRTHAASVLDKLSLRDRTQVMVYALKRGLVRPDELP